MLSDLKQGGLIGWYLSLVVAVLVGWVCVCVCMGRLGDFDQHSALISRSVWVRKILSLVGLGCVRAGWVP